MTAGDALPLSNAALSLDAALGPLTQYAGHRVVELGEDGEQWLVDGHPDETAVLDAVNAYADAMWGEDDGFTLDDVAITRHWSAFRPHRDGCDDYACDPCREGRHDDCKGQEDDNHCECEPTADGHIWLCNCDEYLWFTDFKTQADLLAEPDPDYHAVTAVHR